eukprot:TRINITY_DN6714_c0_g2_i3.p1 TRINITY_DN6714_c0_g2~~TRINITY_DN6714_c0_g2_i3.p1  ORF type:complete len:379 (-),score=100.02 TRINITY_DN6714_c0_g2_i3:202-1338(-)
MGEQQQQQQQCFERVASSTIDVLGTGLTLYVHQRLGYRVLFADIPGPLCTANVVFNTETLGDGGLPHVLEHLVFLGSRHQPYKGFLDLLASRCISNGTNAYTEEDHTCFTVSCAGYCGLLQVMPTYLEHLLLPALHPSHFTTEIYHVDGEGAEAGVLFCEMQGRENTEEDLCSYHTHRLAFPGTCYAVNVGGLTPNIAQLSLEQVAAFHSTFYHPTNMTVVLLGRIPHDQALAALSTARIDVTPPPQQSLTAPDPAPLLPASEVVPFPAQDASVGSVVLAFRGPSVWDVETCLSLEVLFRYLQEGAASPFRQRFVERDTPLAADVDLDVVNFKQTGIGTQLQQNGANEFCSLSFAHPLLLISWLQKSLFLVYPASTSK